jgi:hypothetical protein
MSNYPPFVYEPEKSIDVYKKTDLFLQKNIDIKKKIEDLGWIYFSIGKTIPQTTENFWSGHFFPFMDSWDELQISFNLATFGLYKQAFTSLRSGLELGLLSIYYNINDDGHQVVQDWLKSKNSWEANTPRIDKIWKILNSNNNIQSFDDKLKLRERFDKLSFLHNYVHTKGYKYSNHLGIFKSNFQTFEEKILLKWIDTYQEIITIIITLHLLKYPIGIIEFDWNKKIGIDNPFPVLESFEIEKVCNLLSENYISEIKKIAKNDKKTQDLFNHIKNMSDMTELDKEEQIIRLDKMSIELHPEGFVGWEKQERKLIDQFKYTQEDRQKVLDKIELLKNWAKKKGLL